MYLLKYKFYFIKNVISLDIKSYKYHIHLLIKNILITGGSQSNSPTNYKYEYMSKNLSMRLNQFSSNHNQENTVMIEEVHGSFSLGQ